MWVTDVIWEPKSPKKANGLVRGAQRCVFHRPPRTQHFVIVQIPVKAQSARIGGDMAHHGSYFTVLALHCGSHAAPKKTNSKFAVRPTSILALSRIGLRRQRGHVLEEGLRLADEQPIGGQRLDCAPFG